MYLDSGALYRGVTLFAQENSLISRDNIINPALEKALAGLDLKFDRSNRTLMGSRCIEAEIRTLAVSSQVSPISALAYVRRFVDDILHKAAAGRRVVMDGRDIGTTVFPDAEIKIFLTADPEVRARRRFDELVSKGQNPVMEEVEENLRQRDLIDSQRETSPLVRAADSYLLDNSTMTIGEELAWLRGIVQGKFGILE